MICTAILCEKKKNYLVKNGFFMKALSEIILTNCVELNRGWGRPQKIVLFLFRIGNSVNNRHAAIVNYDKIGM